MNLRIVGGHLALDLANTVAPRPPAKVEVEFLPDPAALLTWARRAGVIDAAESERIARAWSPLTADAALADVLAIRALIDPVLAGDQLDVLSRRWAAAISRSTLTSARKGATLAAGEVATRSANNSTPAGEVATRSANNSTPAAGINIPAASNSAPATGHNAPAAGDGGPVVGNGATLVVGTEAALMIADRLVDAVVDLLRNGDLGRLRACPVAEGGCGFLFLDRSRNLSRRWCSMEDCGTQAKSRRLTERRRARR